MKNSDFHPAARGEFRHAIQWYNREQAGLGTRFARLTFQAIDRIELDQLTGFPSDHDTRTVIVKHFPYQIIFKDFPKQVWIIAVAHTARHPNYWHRRIDDISESAT